MTQQKPQPRDTKHLQKRGGLWWLYYNLPKRLTDHPLYANTNPIRAESLKTDSLTRAKQLRDKIIYEMDRSIEESWEAAQLLIAQQIEAFNQANPHLNPNDRLYQTILEDQIIDQASKQHGIDPTTGNPLKVNDKGLNMLQALSLGNKPKDTSHLLKTITAKLIKELEAANKLAPKTISKIKRSSAWFLDHLLQDDIDIALIDFDQVQDFITLDQADGVSGKTLNGYMYGLGTIWNRAKKSKLVTGNNPFTNHGIPKESTHYDPFTRVEVLALYDATDDEELKTLIHAGYVTGARLGELIKVEVKTPSAAFNHPCWLFNFKSKGKTEQSTRVVPIHSSLPLTDGFTFKISDRTASRQFKALITQTITATHDELTGKPRKLSFHSLRTTLITELVGKHGIDRVIVGGITGHLAGLRNDPMDGYINTDNLATKQNMVELMQWK